MGLTRRRVAANGIAGLAAVAGLTKLGLPAAQALAQAASGRGGQLTIAFPADVPTWDPNARSLAGVQSLYKCVFDQPLDQAPDLSVVPGVVSRWGYLDGTDGLALGLDLRDDVSFHDGSRLTAEDIRYTFFERPRAPVPEGGRRLDTAFLWRRLRDVEVVSPTRAVMRFSEPMPSAVAWLTFLCSFVVPRAHVERVGLDGFTRQPVGSGPYRMVEYQQGARIVLEGFDRHWRGAPAIPRVTIEIVRDPTARVAAVQSRRADLTIDVPVREAQRLGALPGLAARLDPTADIVLFQITRNGGFADDRARLAAHHAINKEAISRAIYGGAAPAIPVPAARDTPGFPEGYDFPFDEARATALLRELGHSPANPLQIKMATTNGFFLGDYDVARAVAQMWRRVGIAAEIEVIEPSVYQERLRANTLPEATLFAWGNAAGDPEMYGGYLLDPASIFSAMKAEALAPVFQPLLRETDEAKRLQGYRDAHRLAAERGYVLPLFQAVRSVVQRAELDAPRWANGWVLPRAMRWQG